MKLAPCFIPYFQKISPISCFHHRLVQSRQTQKWNWKVIMKILLINLFLDLQFHNSSDTSKFILVNNTFGSYFNVEEVFSIEMWNFQWNVILKRFDIIKSEIQDGDYCVSVSGRCSTARPREILFWNPFDFPKVIRDVCWFYFRIVARLHSLF